MDELPAALIPGAVKKTRAKRGRKVNKLHRVQQLAAVERRRIVWQMKVKCASHRAIAAHLGVSMMQVTRDIRRTLAEEGQLTALSVEEHRNMEATRLDDLEVVLAKQVADGQVPAVREARKIVESRRRLFGVDMPVKTELTGAGGGPIQTQGTLVVVSTADIRRRMEEATAVLKALPVMDVESTPAPAAPSEAEAAYAAALAKRNGHGGNGGGT